MTKLTKHFKSVYRRGSNLAVNYYTYQGKNGLKVVLDSIEKEGTEVIDLMDNDLLVSIRERLQEDHK